MRKGSFLSLAALVVCGVPCALAQTTSAPAPAPTVAAPTGAPASDLPSLPGYDQKPMTPVPTAPPPTQVAAPVPPPVSAVSTATQPVAPTPFSAYVPYGTPDEDMPSDHDGSIYIPLDNWVYPALERLYGMGYIDTMFLSMRPYTRRSVMHICCGTLATRSCRAKTKKHRGFWRSCSRS